MLYNSNFDDQEFQAAKKREFNKTIDDPCALQQRQDDNSKKLKFITTNHKDLLDAKTDMNFFGIALKDQLFVPEEKMDDDSNLRYGKTGGVLTNMNTKNLFNQLPLPTLPYRGQLSRGDVATEDTFRNLYETKRNSCNPRDSEYFQRHFYIFDESKGIEVPQPEKSVETQSLGPRGGISTRFVSKK